MKKQLRKKLLDLRKSISSEEVKGRSNTIINKIRLSEEYKNSKIIGIYSPIKNEVDLLELFNDNKTICLPRVSGDEMDFYIVNSIKDLHLGSFNVLEPNYDLKIIDKNKMDIIYTPCVGMSKDLYRIGYGKGFYDKYLKDYKGLKIATCYSFQIVDEKFNDEYDVRMDKIISD